MNVCISVLFQKHIMHVCVPVSVAALEFYIHCPLFLLCLFVGPKQGQPCVAVGHS